MSKEFDLDVVGVIEGTNKSSSFHVSMDFLRHYARLFDRFRDDPINVIEIGVAGGASLSTWEAYFTRAHIVGIDVGPECARFTRERVSIETGSQADGEFLARVCMKYPPTIIIDDGSHHADHIMCAFENMFPFLLPGGLFIVEDLAIHFGAAAEKFKGSAKEWPSDYFLRMARSLLARQVKDDPNPDRARHTLNVDSLEFVQSLLIIRKNSAPRDVTSALEFADEYLRGRKPDAGIHERLGQFILRHAGPLDRAEAELSRAIEFGGETPLRLRLYSEVCRRQNRILEAATSAERAAGMGGDAQFWVYAGNLRKRLGDHTAAAHAYRQAATIKPGDSAVALQLSEALEQQGNFMEALAAVQQALASTTGAANDELHARVERLHAKVNSGLPHSEDKVT